jgi:Ni,Fe-hydrogenase III small subunit
VSRHASFACNGCELEIHALNNPFYNIEGLGICFVASPGTLDILLVTGPLALNMREAVRLAYEATPGPKLVVAAGECACTGRIFRDSYAVCNR